MKIAENPRINMLTYRHLLIKYHLATGGAEFGPVADESFDKLQWMQEITLTLQLWSENFWCALHFYVKNQTMEKLKAWYPGQ